MGKKPQQIIGWQGLTLKVFEDWSVVGFGGDQRSGSMRIDSSGGEVSDAVSGLEVRWSNSKVKQTRELLEARIKPLLRAVEKEGKKAGLPSKLVVKETVDNKKVGRGVTLDFRWTTDRAGHGRIFHCTECGRITVAQAYGSPGTDFQRVSKLVLDTIECHSTQSSLTTWGLYGLLIEIPSNFDLVQQQLMNVYMQLRFQRKNSVEQLMVEQWSLANVQLKGAYLDEWYEMKSVGWTDGVKAEKAETDVNGHPALTINGRRTEITSMVIETARQYARFRTPALEYAGVLWECPESNRAFMVQSFTRKREPELVLECASRTVCHDAEYSLDNKDSSDNVIIS